MRTRYADFAQRLCVYSGRPGLDRVTESSARRARTAQSLERVQGTDDQRRAFMLIGTPIPLTAA